ncbi:MAG: hypothetical protein SA339_13015 [Methanomassiliicoccus sp.]|nr:hypothetical protein [Methanomassiliicoccus sp.]
MGTIRKHEVRILVAIGMGLFAVLAAAIVYGAPNATSSTTSRTHDAMALDGVTVTITGQPERTATGYAVPIDVTNHREEAISIKDMNIVVTLTDISTINATCHGPDFVVPGGTESFLIIIDDPGHIEIFVIDLIQGDTYLRAVMPIPGPYLELPDVPQVTVPDDAATPTPSPNGTSAPDTQAVGKEEPVVFTALSDQFPLRPSYYGRNPPSFGEPATGQLITQVTKGGGATDIGVYLYLPDLSSDVVKVNASFAGGSPVSVQLVSDGASGCYGLLNDGSSPAGSNWTWHYGGSGSPYHNITLTISTFALGTHELHTYALDAGSGVHISEVAASSYSVYGSGGASSTLWMFDTEMVSDMTDPFVPGTVYNLTFKDACRYDEYRGEVRSVFKCPDAISVWSVGGDGNGTLLIPNSLGEYIVPWTYNGTAHEVHLRVQMGAPGGNYPLATGQYWLEDASTGMVLSPVDGSGAIGTVFAVRGPQV